MQAGHRLRRYSDKLPRDHVGEDGENEEERADHTALRSPRGCTS